MPIFNQAYCVMQNNKHRNTIKVLFKGKEMSLTFTKRAVFGGIIASSLSAVTHASPPMEGFTISPSIGYYNFDNDRKTDNDAAYSLGLGYQFDNPWAIEFNYLKADSEKGGKKVGVNEFRVDGLFAIPLFESTNFTPYAAAGIGMADFSKASNSNNAFINAGGGIKYSITEAVALRADFRLINDIEESNLDNITTIGVQYTFGRSHKYTASNDSDIDTYVQQEEPEQIVAAVEPEPEVVEPIVEPVAEEPANTVNLVVPFATNSANVQQKFYPEIEQLAMYLEDHPKATVSIEGYTDDSGPADYNKKLSEKRANAISNVLTNTFNISQERVSSIGYGEEKHLVENDTPEHREENRRVIAIISDNDA